MRGDQLAHERLRVRVLGRGPARARPRPRARPPSAPARRRAGSRCPSPSSGRPTIIASSSRTVNDQLEARRRPDRHVAGAGAHRGQRGHARRAGQPARAADHEHVAGGELRRLGAAARHARAARRGRSGRSPASPARRAGCRCRSPRPRRRRPCRGGSTARLGRWNVAVARAWTAGAGDLAGGGVDAATGRRRRPPAPWRPPSPRSRWSAGSRGEPDEPVPSSASTITCARSSRPAANGDRRGAGQPAQLRLRVLAHPLRRPHEQHLDVAPGLRAAAAPPRARRRRCCPCRRRRDPPGGRPPRRPRAASPSPARSISSATGSPSSSIAQRSSCAHLAPPRAAAPSSAGGSPRPPAADRQRPAPPRAVRRPRSIETSTVAPQLGRASRPPTPRQAHRGAHVAAADASTSRAAPARAARAPWPPPPWRRQRAARCIAGRAPRGRRSARSASVNSRSASRGRRASAPLQPLDLAATVDPDRRRATLRRAGPTRRQRDGRA